MPVTVFATEDAVLDSRCRSGRRVSILLRAALASSALLVGCAELITYSNKSYDQGQQYLAQGRVEDAAGAFRNATQQNPRSYRSFYALGQCYERLGNEQQALQSYRTALDVMPTPAETKEDRTFRDQAVQGLADCVAKSASRDAELTAMTEKAQRTSSPVAWYALARSYAAMGDADNAMDAYDRALRASESRDQPIVKSYGLYLAQINQKQRAEQILIKAYQLDPTDPQVDSALRGIGITPGPSLMEQGQLHRPLVPKGPIPELEVNVKKKS